MNQIYSCFKEDDGYWIRHEPSMKIIATGLKLGVAINLVTILNNLANDVRYNEKSVKSALNRNAKLLKEIQELQTFKKDVINVIDKFIFEERKLHEYYELNEFTARRIDRQLKRIELLENVRKEVSKI